MSRTRPQPSVVRSTVSSWITTSSPSELICTSSSIPSQPVSSAAANESIVFSGNLALTPRWANILLMVVSSYRPP